MSEALLARIWQAQRFARGELRTLDGLAVQVVYPGRRRVGGGPDFQGALVAVDGALQRGGVELHLRPQDWTRHGHDRDPAYNDTVLHVTLWPEATATQRADGTAVPTLALAPYLDSPVEQLALSLPPDPLPWPLTEQGPCAPDPAAILARLEAAGLARFAVRQSRYAAELEERGAPDVLLGGLVEAMGYGANREPARALAAALPAYAAARALIVRCTPDACVGWQALLLGLSALLPSQRGQAGDGRAAKWEQLWRRLSGVVGAAPLAASQWRTAGLRPVSHPVRRLAGLGALLGRRPLEALLGDAARTLLQHPPRPAARRLADLLVVAADGAAEPAASHAGGRAPALLGGERAADIVVNVLLPLLAAWGGSLDHPTLAAAARACYLAHPAAGDNERLRHMRRQILGSTGGTPLRRACLQQGLLHIYAETCDWRRCGECLVDPRAGRADAAEQAEA